MYRRTFIVSAAVTAGGFPAFAQDWKTDPTKFIGQFAKTGIVDILEAKISKAEKAARFRVLFKQYFDIPAIARFVLGRYWKAAQPAEQEKFMTVFEDVIVYTWNRRFSEYNGQSLQVDAAAPDGDDGALVTSRIVGAKAAETFGVAWRLRKRDQGLQIVDVIVEGVSMAITYRQEYASILAQQGGFPGLLEQLGTKAAELAKQVG